MNTPDLSPRQDWTRAEIEAIYTLPLPDLILAAQQVRKANWPEGRMQKSQLLSIKTGGCTVPPAGWPIPAPASPVARNVPRCPQLRL